MSGVGNSDPLLEAVEPQNWRTWIKAGQPVLFILLCVAAGAVAQSLWSHQILTALDHIRSLGKLGWVLLYLLAVFVAAVGALPASLIGIAAGAVYGTDLGFAIAASGLMTGALAGFFTARHRRSRDKGQPCEGNHRTSGHKSEAGTLTQMAAAVEQGGWKIVCMIRLSPVMPFSLISYCMGMTDIAPVPYLVGTLAALPALLLYVMAGHQGTNHGFSAMSAVEIGIGLGATIALGVWAKRQMQPTG
jgi:uncharacterized membrane protein YdjX (TVP38/TMEM64 family)